MEVEERVEMDGCIERHGDGWDGKGLGLCVVLLVRFQTWKVFLSKSYASGQQTAQSDAKRYKENVVRGANRGS